MSKAKSKTPPRSGKTTGTSALFDAMIGKERTCQACGEAKTISRRTFAPLKVSPDGVHHTCRQCQSVVANARKRKAAEEGTCDGNLPVRLEDTKRYWKYVDGLIDDMYEVARDPTRGADLQKVTRQLRKLVIINGDDAPGGFATDPMLAFLTFVRMLSRYVHNWCEFGSIHLEDILPAIVSGDEQTLITASRNTGKSGLVEFYVAWHMLRFPLKIVVILSGAHQRAKRTLGTIRHYIEVCPLLNHLVPDDTCIDKSDAFQVPEAVGKIGSQHSVMSFGMAAKMAGARADLIVLDDIEQKSDSSPLLQETLETRASEIYNLLNPGGRCIALGTPQVGGGMSIYARWIAGEEWSHTKAMVFEEFPGELEGSKLPALHSRWPERFTVDELYKKRRQLGPREWSLHWQIDFGAPDDDAPPIWMRDFIVMRHDPLASTFPRLVKAGTEENRLKHLDRFAGMSSEDYYVGPAAKSADSDRFVYTVAAVDPASGASKRDEVGVAVVSVTSQGLAVIRCCTGIRGRSPEEVMNKTAALIQSYSPNKVVVEAPQGNMWPLQLQSVMGRRNYGVTIDSVWSQQHKGMRIIDSITVPLADKRLVLLESVLAADDAAETVRQICGVRVDMRKSKLPHDDRVDALARAVEAVHNLLLAEPADSMETYAEKDLERMLSLPLRHGGITEDGLEAHAFEMSEDEERLQMKLDQALERQQRENAMGISDPRFDAYVTCLRAEVVKLRRARPVEMVNTQMEEAA